MEDFLGNISPTAAAITLGFAVIQAYYFIKTWAARSRFNNFFKKTKSYETFLENAGNDSLTQIAEVGKPNSDLNNLIKEINHYVLKTKGTTDFSIIQNKVERKLNMRYDQSTVHLSFPTYIGLMGTFTGVFLGIQNFLGGFDTVDGITDTSITELLNGVLVSMVTSLVGLLLTTINNALSGDARKSVEEDKNEFFDFVQTELMPSLDVSMVSAITKLHETVDRFEPAFDGVINRFQETFDRCTKAFGDNFEKNVVAVAGAVDLMGKNMEKINENIDLQEKLISTMKSGELTKGLDRYIEASNNFVSITQSLNKFEEARRMMIAAAQETIVLQNQLAESMKVPREVAIRINQILDRIKSFETSINSLGDNLNKRDMLGNDVLNAIQDQLKGISKKGKITEKYLEMADGKLEDLYTEQTKVLGEMNKRYREALDVHIAGFEEMVAKQTEDLTKRHSEFMQAMEENLSVEQIQQEFMALRRLEPIENTIKQLQESGVDAATLKSLVGELEKQLKSVVESTALLKSMSKEQESIQGELAAIQKETKQQLDEIKKNTANLKGGGFSLFGGR